jgi:hypothetical protein
MTRVRPGTRRLLVVATVGAAAAKAVAEDARAVSGRAVTVRFAADGGVEDAAAR